MLSERQALPAQFPETGLGSGLDEPELGVGQVHLPADLLDIGIRKLTQDLRGRIRPDDDEKHRQFLLAAELGVIEFGHRQIGFLYPKLSSSPLVPSSPLVLARRLRARADPVAQRQADVRGFLADEFVEQFRRDVA